MNEDDSLCGPCQANLRAAVKVPTSLVRSAVNGVFIAELGRQNGSWSTSSCKFCRLLYSMRLDKSQMEGHHRTPSYQLRVFSFLQNYDGIRYEKIDPHCVFKDSITLAAIPANFRDYMVRPALKSHLWTNGHLVCSINAGKQSSEFSGRIIPRKFNPHVVLHWLEYCNRYHTKLCHAAVEIPNLTLIDCQDRTIIQAPKHASYVALSYVWGPSKEVSHEDNIGEAPVRDSSLLSLPMNLPKAIEDAIDVTKDLGFRYIWIDKYCIDQNNDKDKHEQIGQMDLIYKGSAVTIIAAAGEDENTGLPGIRTTRRTIQPVVSLGDITVVSTMVHPHHMIKNSTWMTRGWTLQESVLSRRRLVFTPDQIYFECNAMNCFESLSVPLDLVHTKTKDRYYSFMRSGLFNGRDEGLSSQIFGLPFGNFDDRAESWSYYMKKYLILATNFTRRILSFDSDSLNAFAGIMKHLETTKYPITQLLGIPYLHPSVFPDQRTHLDCAVAALCWRHIHCWNRDYHKIKRRTEFPTWTWAGWEGAVSWTNLFTGNNMDLVSLVDNFTCELEDGTLMKLPQYSLKSGSGLPSLPTALRFSAWLVPPSMISLDNAKNLSWMADSFELQLYMSEFEGDPSDFLECLRTGKLDCIFVAKGLFNSYFLIIEPEGKYSWTFARRVGVAEVIWSKDDLVRCFADEVKFQGAKRDIRLI
jgi:hypothetical protein